MLFSIHLLKFIYLLHILHHIIIIISLIQLTLFYMNPKHEDTRGFLLFHGEVHPNINFNFITILREKRIFDF